jgi:hypothetical protein
MTCDQSTAQLPRTIRNPLMRSTCWRPQAHVGESDSLSLRERHISRLLTGTNSRVTSGSAEFQDTTD